jgi:hypothetical protein
MLLFLLIDSIRLTLTIESRSSDKTAKNHQLIIDDEETSIIIPWFTKEFPLEVRLQLKWMNIAFVLSSYVERIDLMN